MSRPLQSGNMNGSKEWENVRERKGFRCISGFAWMNEWMMFYERIDHLKSKQKETPRWNKLNQTPNQMLDQQ